MDHFVDFALRRTIRPYLGELLIDTVLSVLLLLTAIKTWNLSWIAALVMLWSFVIGAHYPDTRYRIFWINGRIKQIAANKDVTVIDPPSITKIAHETSDLLTLFSFRRPSQRIAIYTGQGAEKRHIDVSLRHFATDDIRKLMQVIHGKRPDLTIPKAWLSP
jgi:hypothetical protein